MVDVIDTNFMMNETRLGKVANEDVLKVLYEISVYLVDERDGEFNGIEDIYVLATTYERGIIDEYISDYQAEYGTDSKATAENNIVDEIKRMMGYPED